MTRQGLIGPHVPCGRPLVLIVEDGEVDRRILEAFVRREGWDVISAADGVEAVELYKAHKPNIVLMDALMPRMNGFDAARHIKADAGDAMVPIIFLTSLQETKELVRCLDAGGDDFLSKPYNTVILGAKLAKFERMRTMHEQLRIEREKAAQSNAHLLQEQAVAKAVFDNIIRPRGVALPNVKQHVSPLSIFNGDVVLTCRTPSGGLNIFLGDFTGHGLPAALGALPAAEIFYGMSARGFAVGDVMAEINRKLKQVLPVGIFCCASMVQFDFRRGDITIWHGGLPDAVIYQQRAGALLRVGSEHLPLGVVSEARFDKSTRRFALALEDRLYLCSDGVIEARNEAGEMFGDHRYSAALTGHVAPHSRFAHLCSVVSAFKGAARTDDDFTFVEVAMVPALEMSADLQSPVVAACGNAGAGNFRLEYELRGKSLAAFNPLPMLQQLLFDVPGMGDHATSLCTVLAELYANALDHGVLALDSRMKDSTTGFGAYFRERENRLIATVDGFVRIALEHTPTMNGGALRIEVTDSGKGFDFGAAGRARDHGLSDGGARALAGRGIALIRQLSESVRFLGDGNRVEVLYRWSH